jgi:hypothetical protein
MSHDADSSANQSGKPAPNQAREDELNRALSAFKKRLKLTKLDQESKLGASRPMTGGKKTEGLGIVPPTQFGTDVWRELATRGKIKDMGGGFYTLP